MRKVTVSRMRERYAHTVLTFRITCVYIYIYIYIYITKGLRQGCSNSPTLFKIYIQNALENWQKMCTKMGLEIQDTTIYSMLFADDHLLIEQDYEDLE